MNESKNPCGAQGALFCSPCALVESTPANGTLFHHRYRILIQNGLVAEAMHYLSTEGQG